MRTDSCRKALKVCRLRGQVAENQKKLDRGKFFIRAHRQSLRPYLFWTIIWIMATFYARLPCKEERLPSFFLARNFPGGSAAIAQEGGRACWVLGWLHAERGSGCTPFKLQTSAARRGGGTIVLPGTTMTPHILKMSGF